MMVKNIKYIDDITFSSWPLIHKAAYCGNYNVIITELDNGISPNHLINDLESLKLFYFTNPIVIYFDMISPLYLAAFRGHYKCVKLLIDRGADPFIKTLNKYYNKSCTPLKVSWTQNNFRSYKYIKQSLKQKKITYNTSLLNAEFNTSPLDIQRDPYNIVCYSSGSYA